MALVGLANADRETIKRQTAHICPPCGRKFSKSEHLQRHLRTHTKERPFECKFCKTTFPRKDSLLRHQRSHKAADGSQSQAAQSPLSTTAEAGSERVAVDTLPTPISVGSGGQLNWSGASVDLLSPLALALPPSNWAPRYGEGAQAQAESFAGAMQGHSLHADLTSLPNLSGQSPDTWPGMNHDATSWLLGQDFDINALNSSLTATISEWAQLPVYPPLGAERPHQEACMVEDDSNTFNQNDRLRDMVRKRWFTQINPEVSPFQSRAVSEGPSDPPDVDERYRANLSRKLRSRVSDDALPSVEHLNLCIKLYFSRFDPIFPIVHAPTFRPTSDNSLLLLSICSVGSLFIGTTDAAAQGVEIFEKLNKAILASWELYLSRSEAVAQSMVQAALIGQTFGMLSGRSKDLVMVDAFHGTVLAWSRKDNAFQKEKMAFALTNEDPDDESVVRAWKSWAHTEQRNRLSLGLHIHDAELACLFHHEPILRHRQIKYPRFASQALFKAPTAAQWWALFKAQPKQPDSFHMPQLQTWMGDNETALGKLTYFLNDSKFVAYGVLESINGSIVEARCLDSLDNATTKQFAAGLTLWYGKSHNASSTHALDRFSLSILWHANFLSLYADFNLLERAIGRNGEQLKTVDLQAVRKWASSPDAVRCVIHALLIQEQVEATRLGAEPAIHVPRSLFSAGIVLICYSRFAPSQQSLNVNLRNFPELELVQTNTSLNLADALSGEAGKALVKDSYVVYGLIDLLRRIGRWGISGTFASILMTATEAIKEPI